MVPEGLVITTVLISSIHPIKETNTTGALYLGYVGIFLATILSVVHSKHNTPQPVPVFYLERCLKFLQENPPH